MIIGVPREIKDREYRVAITPPGVMALTKAGHRVLLEEGAGLGSSICDREFEDSGAEIVRDRRELFDRAEMILKVKEPLEEELDLFHEGQILFTFLHLASSSKLTKELCKRDVIAIAYETVEENGSFPILKPMSEIAGKASVLIGAHFLSKGGGGRGVLLSNVPGVAPARVVIVGGGTVGLNAARVASGLKSDVVIFDVNLERLRYLESILPPNVKLRFSSDYAISEELKGADLLIGAVLVPGARAPKVVSREAIVRMGKGSVVVDVAIDQGGCFETSYPTTHSNPVFEVEGVIHYCVTNIPGIYPITSTYALCHASIPYVLKIADLGLEALINDPALARGVNIFRGMVTNRAVAEAHGLDYVPLEEVLK
jgi:alanine dehydrogenase